MIISLNVSHFCNFKCSWCYLSKEQLANKELLSLNKIKSILSDISKKENIAQIDLYGGEVGLIDLKYLLTLDNILNQYTSNINIITNLSKINPYFLLPNISISVSYDFIFRQEYKLVEKNIKKLNKPISILTLLIPEIYNTDPLEIIKKLNTYSNIESWEIKKYSSNQNNNLNISQFNYEQYILKCLESESKMNYKFINKLNLDFCSNKTYNTFSNAHLYITPQGDTCVLDFDENNNEYFKVIKSLNEYDYWCENEVDKAKNNKYCSSCKYFGNCYTEHLRFPTQDPKIYSCDGAFKLLNQYEIK